MNRCACGCGKSCQGQYARGHHPRSHEYAAPAPSQSMVLEAIASGAKTRPKIATALNVSPRYLGNILTRLRKRGKIRRGRRMGEWEAAL